MHAHDRWPQSTERYAGTTLKAFERQALLLRIISSTMPSYLAVFLLGAKTLSPNTNMFVQSGNKDQSFANMVRQQFKANMNELDDEK
eukprot:scaffold133767_cov21-Tisochrysis_lutea.AAC.1